MIPPPMLFRPNTPSVRQRSSLGAGLSLLVLVQAAAILLVFCSCPAAPRWHTVRWIDDGDTIVLTGGERIRYIGIDTPELQHGDGREEPFARQAKALNTQLVLHEKIRLERDRDKVDRYGRSLAYVFAMDGTFVNRELVRSGLARCLHMSPNGRYRKALLEAQRDAMKAGRGMWAHPFRETGPCMGNSASRRFHRLRCPLVKRMDRRNAVPFASTWQAFWEGYSPCSQCYGPVQK